MTVYESTEMPKLSGFLETQSSLGLLRPSREKSTNELLPKLVTQLLLGRDLLRCHICCIQAEFHLEMARSKSALKRQEDH